MAVTHPLFPNGSGTPAFVLDVTVTLEWLLPNPRGGYAWDVLTAVPSATPVVPGSWILHLADALLGAERRGLLTPARATSKLAALSGYPILFDDETDARLWPDILPLARAHDLPTADAAYLELALRLSLPLATTDPALSRAAAAAGAPLFNP